MRKWLMGPFLSCVAVVAGSYYGAEAKQVVRKGPGSTYEGLSRAIDSMPHSGTTYFKGGQPMRYELQIERQPGERLFVRMMFDGREGATTEFRFTPQNDGEETLVTAKAHGSYDVLHTTLAGTSSAPLAYAPDWMLNLFAVRPQLQKLAAQIESGEPVSMPGFQSQAEWESSLSPEQQ